MKARLPHTRRCRMGLARRSDQPLRHARWMEDGICDAVGVLSPTSPLVVIPRSCHHASLIGIASYHPPISSICQHHGRSPRWHECSHVNTTSLPPWRPPALFSSTPSLPAPLSSYLSTLPPPLLPALPFPSPCCICGQLWLHHYGGVEIRRRS